MLLLSRLALGGVVAAAGPAIASLVGDLFPGDERARLYGYILTGELIGAGLGILIAGALSDLLGWRFALGFLAAPACALAWALHRYLPEPARGGQAHLQTGDEHIVTEEEAEPDHGARSPSRSVASDSGGREPGAILDEPSAVEQQAANSGAQPYPGTVVEGNEDMNLWDAVIYVLKVRTNVALIVASGLGYFFFAGLETFAELYFRARYGVGQSLAALLFVLVATGALVGVVLSGRTADRMIHEGKTSARIWVAAVAYVASTVLFIPGALITVLPIAIPVFFIAAVALGAVNAPADAARLDVLPSHLWGRAEAVRTVFRQTLQGFAPVLFGAMSGVFGATGAGFGSGVATSSLHGSSATAHGLEMAFIILSVPLAAAGIVLWLSRKRYLADVVAARQSDENRAESASVSS
jgi:MFS family permease